MKGHIVKRTGKKKVKGKPESLYYIVYTLPNQKQRWETVRPPRTRERAEKLLAERLSQVHRGEFIEPKKITFSDFKDIWMEKYAEPQVRSSTLARYRVHFRKHIIPFFGDLRLAQVGVEDVQGFKAELIGKGLAPGYVKHHLALIRQMLDFAVDWEYIRTNPAKKVKYPAIPKREMDCLSPEEVRVFLKKIPERWYAFMLVAITTGVRIGELLAMRWENVDWRQSQYFVKEALKRKNEVSPREFGPPKTEESVALVDLTPVCLDALREQRRLQAAEKLKAGEDYQDQYLIFATSTGGPLDEKNVTNRVFRPALEAAGIRTSLRFQDLRHTCASLLIDQGENPKYIQKQMRHASIDITFDTYGHLFPESNQEAARRLDETLFGKGAGVADVLI